MNKKILMLTIMAVFLAVSVSAAGLISPLAHTKTKPQTDIHYANIGLTTITIPDLLIIPELPNPNIIIGAMDKIRSPFGAYDVIDVHLYVPGLPLPMPVMVITDNAEAKAFYEEDVFVNWWPPENIILVEDDELEVWKKDNTVYANLTVPVTVEVTWPPFPSPPPPIVFDFTLPPCFIKFDGFDKPYSDTIIFYLDEAYGLSGYTITRTCKMNYNAFVSFECEAWGIPHGFRWNALGTTMLKAADTFIPPPPE